MSTGKTTGKWSWKDDEGVVQSITHVVFMSSPGHGMSGWDWLGTRRNDCEGLAKSREQDIPPWQCAHLYCGGKNKPEPSKSSVSEQFKHGSILAYWRWSQEGLLRLALLHDGSLLLPIAACPLWSNSDPGMHLLAVNYF